MKHLILISALALTGACCHAQQCGNVWQTPQEPVADCSVAYGEVAVAVYCDREYVINVQCAHVPGLAKGQCIAEGMMQVVDNEMYWDCLVTQSCSQDRQTCGDAFNYQPHKVFDASGAVEANAKLDLHLSLDLKNDPTLR